MFFVHFGQDDKFSNLNELYWPVGVMQIVIYLCKQDVLASQGSFYFIWGVLYIFIHSKPLSSYTESMYGSDINYAPAE